MANAYQLISIQQVDGLAAALDAAGNTPAETLAALLTVDGAGSGLDADTLDGYHASAFVLAGGSYVNSFNTRTGPVTLVTGDVTGALGFTPLNATSYTAADVLSKLLTVDGSGSGVDADLLDGQDGSYYANSTHTHTFASLTSKPTSLSGYGITDAVALTGAQSISGVKTFSDITVTNLIVNGTTTTINSTNLEIEDGVITLARGNSSAAVPYGGIKFERGGTDAFLAWNEANDQWYFALSTDDLVGITGTSPINANRFISDVVTGTAPLTVASTTMVNNLNAQYLNGQLGSYYQDAGNLNAGTLLAARMPAHTGDVTSSAGSIALTLATVNGNVGSFGSATAAPIFTVNGKGLITAASSATITPAWASVTSKPTTLSGYSITASDVLTNLLTVDGSGSGLDADLLDGYDSVAFPRKAETATISAAWTFNSAVTVSTSINSTVQQWQGAGTNFNLLLTSGNGVTASTRSYRLALDYLAGAATNGYIDFFRGTAGGDGFLAFGTSGAERVRIDAVGNVGIGSTNPSWKLSIATAAATAVRSVDISGSTTGFNYASISNTSGSLWWGVEGSTAAQVFGSSLAYASLIGSSNATALQLGTNGSARLTIDNTGNVGIGTATPSVLLDVVGANADGGLQYRTSIRTVGLGQSSGEAAIYWGSGTRLNFTSGGAIPMMIAATTGNVGMGTTSPGAKLSIFGGSLTSAAEHSLNISTGLTTGRLVNAGSGILSAVHSYYDSGYLELSQGSSAAYVSGIVISPRNAGDLVSFWTRSVERMRVDGVGNVGIGTTGPTGKLTVLTTGDSTPATVGAYDTRHAIFGPTTADGLAISKATGGSAYITSLRPGVNWDPLTIQASALNFNGNGGATVFSVTSAGVAAFASTINAGGSITTAAGSNLIVGAQDSNTGVRLWGDDVTYSIYMQGAGSVGRAPTETTSDYNTYFSQAGANNRGWGFKIAGGNVVAGIDGSGNMRSRGWAKFGGSFQDLGNNESADRTSRYLIPTGASYTTQTSTVTGAIRIRLPIKSSSAMLKMKVEIYQYNVGVSHSLTISGYPYASSAGVTTWVNCSVEQFSDSGAKLTVRFGYDGTYDYIYIGELATAWAYPQVFVTDFVHGYSGYSSTDAWSSNWNIGFVTAGFDNVSVSRAAALHFNTTNSPSHSELANSPLVTDGNGYANLRVIRNLSGGTADGMYIGYGNAGSGLTRIYGGGSTSASMRIYSTYAAWFDGSTDQRVWYNGNLPVQAWQTDVNGHQRFYFGSGADTYFGTQSGYIFRNSAAADIASLTSTGAFTALLSVTSPTVSATSDGRLKKLVTPLVSASQILDQMKPSRFTWKKTDKKSVGFIAQDLQEILPEAIHESADGTLAVEHLPVIAVLAQALKETRAQLMVLQSQVESLTNGAP